MPSIHACRLCKPINVHGVVPQQLVSLCYLCQGLVAWPWFGLSRLCIDVRKECLHFDMNVMKLLDKD